MILQGIRKNTIFGGLSAMKKCALRTKNTKAMSLIGIFHRKTGIPEVKRTVGVLPIVIRQKSIKG